MPFYATEDAPALFDAAEELRMRETEKPTREDLASLLAALHFGQCATADDEKRLRRDIECALKNFDIGNCEFFDSGSDAAVGEPGPAHNGHPMRHWDRTCPACNPHDAPTEAEQVCLETYAAIGTILMELAEKGHPQAEKLMDNLSQAKMVHKDVVPFEDVADQRRQELLSGQWDWSKVAERADGAGGKTE